MCHVSVGHVARAFEQGGIPTVIAMSDVFRDRVEAMRPPRVLLTPNPMGRPIAAPFDEERQRDVLRAALALLERKGQRRRKNAPWKAL